MHNKILKLWRSRVPLRRFLRSTCAVFCVLGRLAEAALADGHNHLNLDQCCKSISGINDIRCNPHISLVFLFFCLFSLADVCTVHQILTCCIPCPYRVWRSLVRWGRPGLLDLGRVVRHQVVVMSSKLGRRLLIVLACSGVSEGRRAK